VLHIAEDESRKFSSDVIWRGKAYWWQSDVWVQASAPGSEDISKMYYCCLYNCLSSILERLPLWYHPDLAPNVNGSLKGSC